MKYYCFGEGSNPHTNYEYYKEGGGGEKCWQWLTKGGGGSLDAPNFGWHNLWTEPIYKSLSMSTFFIRRLLVMDIFRVLINETELWWLSGVVSLIRTLKRSITCNLRMRRKKYWSYNPHRLKDLKSPMCRILKKIEIMEKNLAHGHCVIQKYWY